MLVREPPLTLRIDDAPMPAPLASGGLHERSVPLVALDGDRLVIVASACLWRLPGEGRRRALSTAAHLFELGIRVGDLGIASVTERRVVWLGSLRPSLHIHRHADIALIALERAGDIGSHWHAHEPALLDELESPSGAPAPAADCHVLAGWPTGQSLWTGRALTARPVICFTTRSDHGPDTYRYRRIADRDDGTPVITPELDGVSGALLWRVRPHDVDRFVLEPAGVQVSFEHGRFVRCEPVAALATMLRLA